MTETQVNLVFKTRSKYDKMSTATIVLARIGIVRMNKSRRQSRYDKMSKNLESKGLEDIFMANAYKVIDEKTWERD